MDRNKIISLFEKEIHCYDDMYDNTCSDSDYCSECEYFVSDRNLHEAIKAAIVILKEDK